MCLLRGSTFMKSSSTRACTHQATVAVASRASGESPASPRITSYNVCYTKLLRIAAGEAGRFRPVSALFAAPLAGLSADALHSTATVAWWVHALVLLLFMNVLPRSKHMHILTAISYNFV